jgi:hypothetical protein
MRVTISIVILWNIVIVKHQPWTIIPDWFLGHFETPVVNLGSLALVLGYPDVLNYLKGRSSYFFKNQLFSYDKNKACLFLKVLKNTEKQKWKTIHNPTSQKDNNQTL